MEGMFQLAPCYENFSVRAMFQFATAGCLSGARRVKLGTWRAFGAHHGP
jgi:hypothetical protein